MKVLLLKDVYKLGRAGEVKKVADGYGRNFLLPRNLVVAADAKNIANNAAFLATGDITKISNGDQGITSQTVTAQIFRRIATQTSSGTETVAAAINSSNSQSKANGRESFTDADTGLGAFLTDWSSRTTITSGAAQEQVSGSFEFSPNKPLNVGIITTGSSWLRVLVDGKTVFEGVAPEGKQFSWSGDQRISVRAGNAGAVMLAFNGKNARRLGKEGDVIEKRFGSDTDGSNNGSAMSSRLSNGSGGSSASVVESSPRTFR